MSAINTKCRIVYGNTGMVDYSKAAMKMLLKILVEQEGINSCQINRKLRNCTCKERKRLVKLLPSTGETKEEPTEDSKRTTDENKSKRRNKNLMIDVIVDRRRSTKYKN